LKQKTRSISPILQKGETTTPYSTAGGAADLEKDDLDLVYLEVGCGGVMWFASAVDVILRVAEIAAV